MSSPEFKTQLQAAKEFRRNEANALLTIQKKGLKSEAREYLQSLRHEDAYIKARQMVWYERCEKLGKEISEFTQEQWEETGQVLSGLNNGVKAGLFLEIAQNTQPDTYIPTDTVVDRFKDIFAGTELLEALNENSNTRSQVILYCQESLCDIGLLAAAYETDDWWVQKLVGFGVTERGRRIGIPTALSVLWYENKTHKSLYPVLGITSSSGKTRAPYNRIRILNYLVHHPFDVREADLVTALGLDKASIEYSLRHLNYCGMIDYKAVTLRTGKTQVRYKRVEGKSLTDAYYPSYRSLQDQIVRILEDSSESESISAADIFRRLPDEFKRNWKEERNLKTHISINLSHLSTQGYLTRVDRFRGGEKQSDASFTPKGRNLYFQLVYPILLLSSGGALSRNYLSHLEEADNNLALYAPNSAELYYPYSSSSKMRKSRENKLQVLKILQDNPNLSFTTQELSKKMGLEKETIMRYLNPQIPGATEITFHSDKETVLVIQREKVNGVWYFRVKNSEDK